MTIRFSIAQWAAWAPGLPDQAAWSAWLRAPAMPVLGSGPATPALTEMPAMMRRRVERLGRIALQAAYGAQAEAGNCPVLFASRYGDLDRIAELLRQLARGEPTSPTAFSMSVHNAIGALFSIARADPGNYSAIAAGEETIEAAFTEASALLADGAPAVLLVYYEEPLPAPYQGFAEPGGLPDFPRAWACRLIPTEQGGYSLCSRQAEAGGAEPAVADLPADLAVLRFLLSGTAPTLTRRLAGKTWHWRQDA
ncbi:beta-ketoacyl synthase chain length factor [Chitinimonas arctica]|uniref:Beta-ketoacyl synthase chain length factor n=1 Tax=Chitinimonas arctica TaxID=2594795 RepID=A0A516SI35_9NEIS|nr:beta-ketoacyl synthase chain length factor [Chitinimonas arctica]QDQ27803.1 beta-ketoacyl synthase chain length factor [Chitinimonas arctica]